MKNKKFTYLLLACVVLLWGVIFFKVYATMADEEPSATIVQKPKSKYFNLVNHEEDSVKIGLNYRNPFATTSMEPLIGKDITVAPRPQPIPIPKKQLVSWNEVTYKGYINNPLSKQRIVIVSIQAKEVMLVEGQNANGLKLLRSLGDSIKVSYQNETKFIKLK